MKWIILILMTLFIASVIFADEGITETYKPNEKFSLGVHLSNKTGDVENANCSVQIRLSNFTVKDEFALNNSGGGFYNATYNVSETGDYPCRFNCTRGDKFASTTCNFTIKGDTQMQIALVIIMGFVITFLFVLSRYIKIEAIKVLLIAIASMVLLVTINIGMAFARENATTSVQNLINTVYLLVLYPLEFILALGIIFVMLYYVVKWLPQQIKFKRKQ